MRVKRLMFALSLALAVGAAPLAAEDSALRLIVPQAFIDNGLTTRLLPRFRFKSRLRVEPVSEGEADMALASGGVPVFRTTAGAGFGLAILTDNAERAAQAQRFLDWLQSEPGRTAIASFEVDGEQILLPGDAAEVVVAEVEVEGDADHGAKLALAHCGRCHVVDERNPFGGIGSTPSFRALRAAPDWRDRFSGFWVLNPHPAFTQIEDMTLPFHPERPPPIAPLELTLEDTQAITAFVATLTPKDLGAGVEAR